VSHINVFAVGDVSKRVDVNIARSGVHAVRAGPVLAHNLLRAIDDKTDLKPYRPLWSTLYILAINDRYAVASWGIFSFEGRWIREWKDRIDRQFVERFSK
jgi:NADH dehydrogenase FAD-containing subunit